MKRAMLALLLFAVLAFVGYCSYLNWFDDGLPKRRGWSKEELANLARSGRELRAVLNLPGFRGSDECYTWSTPAVVSISNRTFKIDGVGSDPHGRAYWFDVRKEVDGVFMRVCSFQVVVAPSAEAAVNFMSEELMRYHCLSPLGAMAYLNVEFDSERNVLVEHRRPDISSISQDIAKGRSGSDYVVREDCFDRTYGNIYIDIRIWDGEGVGNLCAKDFALPLLEAGASRR